MDRSYLLKETYNINSNDLRRLKQNNSTGEEMSDILKPGIFFYCI